MNPFYHCKNINTQFKSPKNKIQKYNLHSLLNECEPGNQSYFSNNLTAGNSKMPNLSINSSSSRQSIRANCTFQSRVVQTKNKKINQSINQLVK
jgi:hypothetical protein